MMSNNKYAHIERYLQLGIIHLEYPRCIYWYGSGFGDIHTEWIDKPSIREGTQVLQNLEQKTLELQRDGTKDFLLLDYFEYMESVKKYDK